MLDPLYHQRPFDPATDFPFLLHVYNQWAIVPATEEMLRDGYAREDAQKPYRFDIAFQGDAVIGFLECRPVSGTGLSGNVFSISIRIASEMRGKGYGSHLYRICDTWVQDQGANFLRAYIRDDDSLARTFVEHRGFQMTAHTFRSILDLSAISAEQVQTSSAEAKRAGIRFFSLKEVGQTEENQRRLYDLNQAALVGEPTFTGEGRSYEAFQRDVYGGAWFLPEGQIIAMLDEEWVGLAAVGRFPTADMAFNAFTGILPEYRGRRVAQALKVQALLFARSLGVSHIWTNNDSRNAPMLHINRKLGYIPQPGMLRMEKPLNQETSISHGA